MADHDASERLITMGQYMQVIFVAGFFQPLLLVAVPLQGGLLAGLVTWNLGDPVFRVQGLTKGERIAWLRQHLGPVLRFGGVAALFLSIPVLGLLLLPVGVAGAAFLFGAMQPQRAS